jgi:DNA-3-methyladenine glycosylase
VNASSQFTQQELSVDPAVAAPLLLGSVLEVDSAAGPVGVRIVEVEAYRGADDPASHAYRGKTPRNAVMFGPAGFLYVYFVYGMHFCANVVCMTEGVSGAVLLRAGEVVTGVDLARTRRSSARNDAELGKGPARLATALGLSREHNGADLLKSGSSVRLLRGKRVSEMDILSGPRVGVAVAMETPWRFWVADSPAVSAYRRGGKAARINKSL